MDADTSDSVNPHYLDHVVTTAQTHEVEVTDDIVTPNGIKLLAKGSRIDPDVRERLLQHKLRKPLEDCVQVVGGVIPARFGPIADALLDRYPLLQALCAPGRARPAPETLASLTLSLPMQSLLTVYAQYQEDRLDHTVGVALIALVLARRLIPGAIDRHRMLATAGLVHDVGELYIDPAILRKGVRLDTEQWRHIVTHPLVGHRVLRPMDGAGPEVADAVLLHHERLDGFGYPRRISGDAFGLNGQILAASEWLMALAESGRSPLARASMAARLVPGEFSREVLEAVAATARAAPDTPVELASAKPLEEAVPRILRLADVLRRFSQSRALIEQRASAAQPGLRAVLATGLQRMLRVQVSFSSTGLDAHSPESLLAELAALRDPRVYTEIMMMVGEMEWRMREVEREQRLRASLLSSADQAVVEEFIDQLKGVLPVEGAVAA